MSSNREVREMRDAATVLNIIRGSHEERSLESHVIRKAVMRGSEEGRWKSTRKGNSLATYPTSRTVLRGGSGGNVASLPDLGRPPSGAASVRTVLTGYRLRTVSSPRVCPSAAPNHG